MPLQTVVYPDLGGGLNSGSSPEAIETKEMSHLVNWYPYSTFLRRRGGTRRLISTPWASGDIISMFPLKKSDGVWTLLVGGATGFGRVDGSGIVDLSRSVSTPPSLGNSTKPWVMFQYKDYAYALRADSGQLLRLDTTSISRAGIGAPPTAPAIAAGAAGALGAGNYQTVYTFYNTQTALESNPSPASNLLALGGSLRIDHSQIAVSGNPIVNARRVYRTVVGQTGMYFFVFQINNNVDTVFTGEQVLPADMGRSVSFNNGLPPDGLELGVIWQERLFASDGTNLFFSQFLLPEMFGSDILPIFPDDGHVISGLHAFGDRLIVGKTNAVHYLVGTDPSNFGLHTLSDKHGIKSHHSIKSAESSLFFYGTGKAVFRSDGTYVKDISTPKVADILAQIPDVREHQVVGAVFPALNWYALSIPQGASQFNPDGDNSTTLIYNYKYDTWTTFENARQAPQFLVDFFDANYGQVLYSTHYDGMVYKYNDETYNYDDVEAGGSQSFSFPAVLDFKADDFGYPGYRHFLEETWLLMKQTSGTLQVEVYGDGRVSPDLFRVIQLSSLGPLDGWLNFKTPTARTPSARTRMRLTYNGPLIDLEQAAFRTSVMHRQSMQPR